MTWAWLLLFLFGYYVVGIITLRFLELKHKDSTEHTLMAIMWPLTIPTFLIIGIWHSIIPIHRFFRKSVNQVIDKIFKHE